jgi:hypothetical protein
VTITQDPLSDFKALGDAPPARAAASGTPSAPLATNGHVHLPPNFSAFSSVAEAVQRAATEQVRVLGASNYYHFGAYAAFASEARAHGVVPLYGLEVICLIDDLARAGVKINDPGNPGKMYLCGKGITRFSPMNESATVLLDTIRAADGARAAAVIARLEALFRQAGLETGVTDQSVKAMIAHRHNAPLESVFTQERHIAQAFQAALFQRVATDERATVLGRVYDTPSHADPTSAVAVQNELRAQLMKAGKGGYVAETFVDFDHAFRLILALGGIPCYPTLADGVRPLCAYEDPVEGLIADLRRRRIFCAELIPNRNTPAVLDHYVRALRGAGLVVTAGTEHNTLDLIPMTPRCAGGAALPATARDVFWEGACVVAAHQYRMAQGEPGFVDAMGRPDPSYATDELRIAAYARLGAAVIETLLSDAPRA